MATTLIIRYDADLTGLLATDAAEHGYDADAVLESYLDRVEQIALDELEVDDVDVDRNQANCSGATKRSEVSRTDGSEMSDAERYALEEIERRALEQAIESACTVDK